ncbi:MAG: ArsR/SmtB family transcription factor [Acetobacteraceae bacterium]
MIEVSSSDLLSPQAVTALAALAHEHRLALFRLLVERGPGGLPAGVIAERLGLAPSSLTFHLQHLHRAGLVSQRRVGRNLIYAADFAAMNALLAYLTRNCCGRDEAAGAFACHLGAAAYPPDRRIA